jgi:hypothetical protein
VQVVFLSCKPGTLVWHILSGNPGQGFIIALRLMVSRSIKKATIKAIFYRGFFKWRELSIAKKPIALLRRLPGQ